MFACPHASGFDMDSLNTTQCTALLEVACLHFKSHIAMGSLATGPEMVPCSTPNLSR